MILNTIRKTGFKIEAGFFLFPLYIIHLKCYTLEV